jgi:hypothetical protein
MDKIKPKFSMLIMYGVMFAIVLILILLYVERNEFIKSNGLNPWVLLLIIAGGSLIGGISLSLRTFMNRYFIIEIDDQNISGPSLFGINWRKVSIPIKEIKEISKNGFLIFMGIYILKSIKGEIICISGFDEDQFTKLASLINARKKFDPSKAAQTE